MCLQAWVETNTQCFLNLNVFCDLSLESSTNGPAGWTRAPVVIPQVLLSWFSRTKFKLEKLADWLGAETNDLRDDRKAHTSPDNATVHALNGYTCCFIYFRWLNLLIPTLWLKPKGFEYQVLAHDLKICLLPSLYLERATVECQWKYLCSVLCCSVGSPLPQTQDTDLHLLFSFLTVLMLVS